MNQPILLADTGHKVMDAWSGKILSKEALPDNIVGQNSSGTQFIIEECCGIPILAVVLEDGKVRSTSVDEYNKVVKEIAEGRFLITEIDPVNAERTVIHEATGQPLVMKRPVLDASQPSF